jgi:TatD DNase family protein
MNPSISSIIWPPQLRFVGNSLSYVDAHLHLADAAYAGTVETVLENAAANDVKYLLSNGMDYDSSVKTLALAERYKGKVLAAGGIHPWTAAGSNTQLDLEIFEKLVGQNRDQVTAIGEIGLDGQYSKDEEKRLKQREVFLFFLRLAERCKLPAIVHSRLAVDEVLSILPSYAIPKVVLHRYSGSAEHLQSLRDRGYLITVGPSILYSKRTHEIARRADPSMLLTETDGPVTYFGPFKGKTTYPAFVIDVVKKLAELKKENIDHVRSAVWNNFQSFITKH